MMKTLSLDHAATTPLDERVLVNMLPFMTDEFSAMQTQHTISDKKQKNGLKTAREKVAYLINGRTLQK